MIKQYIFFIWLLHCIRSNLGRPVKDVPTLCSDLNASWINRYYAERGEGERDSAEQTVDGLDIWLLLTCVEAVEGWRYSLGLTATVVAILSCCSGKHTDTAESDSGGLRHLFSVVRLFKDNAGHSYKTETDLRKTNSVMVINTTISRLRCRRICLHSHGSGLNIVSSIIQCWIIKVCFGLNRKTNTFTTNYFTKSTYNLTEKST